MDDSDKKKNGNEFLKDLRSIINEAIADDCENDDDLADKVINKLVYLWGGEQVYVVKNIALRKELAERNKLIYQKFNGKNRHAICREFGLSEVQFYNIIRRIHDEKQGDLFKG